jgi:hypothetical protein
MTVGRSDVVRAVAQTSAGIAISGKTFSFSVNNPAVLTLAADGTIKAVAPGTAIVTATVDGITGQLVIVATDASLYSLSLSGVPPNVYVGASVQLGANGKDSSSAAVALRSVTWSSSNPQVATVSSSGVLTALSVGTTTISVDAVTVTELIETVAVTVKLVPVASVRFLANDTLVPINVLRPLSAAAFDSAGNQLVRAIAYASSNVDVATIDGINNVTPHLFGAATITATSATKTASQRFVVVPVRGIVVVGRGGTQGDLLWVHLVGTSIYRSYQSVVEEGIGRVGFDSYTQSGASGIRDDTYRAIAADAVGDYKVTIPVAVKVGTRSVAFANSSGSVYPTIDLFPYSATISAPDTVAAGSTVTISWSMDSSILVPSTASTQVGPVFFVATGPFIDGKISSGTRVTSTTTVASAGTPNQFTTTFTAPATPSVLYYQVGYFNDLYYLMSPNVTRGETLRTIVVK